MKIQVLIMLAGSVFLANGCTHNYPRHTEPNIAYLKAMESTSSQMPDDPDGAVSRVTNLFADFSRENLEQNIEHVYADSFYFRDGFKELHKLNDLKTYMLESTKPLRLCTFIFSPPVFNAPDCYLLWTMKVNFMRDKPDQVEEVIGISRLRFNKEGKVVFQQDYWDPTDVLYRRIPLANGMIGYVRSRM